MTLNHARNAPAGPRGGYAQHAADDLPWHVPDPAKPFFMPPQHTAPGKRWLSQTHTRSKILAAARMCMAADGFGGVHLKSIAAECGISVQTIYNIVGDRVQVLRESSSDWVLLLAEATRSAHAEDQATEKSRIFAIIETFWATPLRWPNYVKWAVESSLARRQPLNEPFFRSATKVLRDELLRLEHSNNLLPAVDTECLARQLTTCVHSIICNHIYEYPLWSSGFRHPATSCFE